MTKEKIIADILSRNIHHNIRMDYGKLPTIDEEEARKIGFDLFAEAGYMIEDFKNYFEDLELTPQNDNGNRNIGDPKTREKDGIDSASYKGKIWQSGRMGATLYWDAYYNENGRITLEDYNLEEMEKSELERIQADLDFYDAQIAKMMKYFYEHISVRIKELQREYRAETRAEKARAKAEKDFAFNFFAYTDKIVHKLYGKHCDYHIKDNVISFATADMGEFSIIIKKK